MGTFLRNLLFCQVIYIDTEDREDW